MSDVANSARFISVLVTTYLVITKAEIKRAPFATTDISLRAYNERLLITVLFSSQDDCPSYYLNIEKNV